VCLEYQIHSDDSIAMHILSERLKKEGGGLIHYAWSQDSSTALTSSSTSQSTVKPPFCSIIMTEHGILALKEWGQEVAFMDSTHGITRYGFPFTALVVKDSHSNHWPVALMFHEAETEQAFVTFLTKIRDVAGAAGVSMPKAIVTDISTAGNSITHKFINVSVNLRRNLRYDIADSISSLSLACH
jgi:hypothetical protein